MKLKSEKKEFKGVISEIPKNKEKENVKEFNVFEYKPEGKYGWVKVGNNLIYSDPVFEALKAVISTNENLILRGVKYIQPNNGPKMIFYQGDRSNNWGFIESIYDRNNNFVRFRMVIINALLKNELMKDKRTKEYINVLDKI